MKLDSYISREKWKRTRIIDVCEINPDRFLRSSIKGSIRYLEISSVGTGVISEQPEEISSINAPSRAQRILKVHDIILSTVRPNRRSLLLVPNELDGVIASSGFCQLRARKDLIHPYFLYGIILQEIFTEYLVSREQGAAYPAVNSSMIGEYEFLLPPIYEQRKIAECLSAITNKIELNRRLNETLEAMAQAIFKDWFVDFGPVRRKAAGIEDPVAILGGMIDDPARASAIAALFPDRFSENGLPEGWAVGTLQSLIQFNPPYSLKKGQIAPYVEMAALPTNGPTIQYKTLREYSSGSRFMNGDTLFARITPCLENGKSAFVDILSGSEIGWGSTEFIVLRSIPPVPKEFSYLIARHGAFRECAIQNMTGTSGRQRVNEKPLMHFKIAIANEKIYSSFSNFIVPIFDLIASRANENQSLAETRDYLLPKLMSGEIRVHDAEALARI